MALAFLRANPALQPLAIAVGLGVGGAVAFGLHYASSNQDVVINKKVRDPWNKDFWKTRTGLPDPRLSFVQDLENKDPKKLTEGQKSYLERARQLNAQASSSHDT